MIRELCKWLSMFSLLGFLFAKSVSAATFSFSGQPTLAGEDESFTVSVNLTIANSAGNNYYLRAAFSSPDTPTSYFGFTKNNTDTWYNGSPTIDYRQFYKVTMNEFNTWTGAIPIKPDGGSTAFKGSGSYNLKIGRYTDSGSGPTWSDNSETLTITALPSPSPSPSPSPTPSPDPSPSPTPSPSSTPSPHPSPITVFSPKPSPKPSPRPTLSPTPLLKESENSQSSIVMGISTEASPVVETSPEATNSGKTFLAGISDNILPISLIGAGIAFLGVSAVSFFKGRHSDIINSSE